jgi:hypothetical protein
MFYLAVHQSLATTADSGVILISFYQDPDGILIDPDGIL